MELREKIKKHGARRDKRRKLWILPYEEGKALGLSGRIVQNVWIWTCAHLNIDRHIYTLHAYMCTLCLCIGSRLITLLSIFRVSRYGLDYRT